MAIGFGSREQGEKRPVFNVPDSQVIIRYNSGVPVAIEDARTHMMFLGSTGTFKTTSGVMPALHRRLAIGQGGLLIDIKGNMTDRVLGLAKHAGRQGAVVEFGTEASAMPRNILKDMDPSAAYNFFVQLMEESFNRASGNMDFHIKGASMARDAFILLKYLGRLYPEYEPNLITILEMFGDWAMATRLFELFRKHVADEKDEEQRKFIRQVESAQFHILTQTEKKLNRAGPNHFEQMSYNTQGIITALRAFLDTPGVAEKFCAFGAPSMDILKLVMERKIIILRFGPQSGRVGAQLARTMLNTFYAAIYSMGVGMPDTFVCIDEFQEVADLSDGRFSDTNFVALAREFNCSFMAATQSASALANRGNSEASVSALLSNVNNKSFFFTEDPLTREIARRYDPAVDLVELKAGECFRVSYHAETHSRSWGRDSLTDAWKSIRDIEPVLADPIGQLAQRPSLLQLGDKLEAMYSTATDSENRTDQGRFQRISTQERKKEMKRAEQPEKPWQKDEVQDMFPEIFTEYATVHVPAGWRSYLVKVLGVYRDLGMPGLISEVTFSQHGIQLRQDGRGSGDLRILTPLLERVSQLCMLCGEPMTHASRPASSLESPHDAGEDDYNDDSMPEFMDHEEDEEEVGICAHCQEKRGLLLGQSQQTPGV